MTTARRKCAGLNANGDPCRNPVVGEDGCCTAHRAGGEAKMKELGYRCALASRASKGIDPDELGPLETLADARRWLEVIGRAVVSGQVSDRAARAALRAVSEWMRTKGDELKADVDRLKAELAGRKGRKGLKAMN